MNTSKYDHSQRKTAKRDQRTDAYRDLQQRSAKEREALETKLRERNATIDKLSKELISKGVDAAEVAKLAA